MGQGTGFLEDYAEPSGVSTERLAREAYEGRLRLSDLPRCKKCGEEGPCKPDCANAARQVLWLGDWFRWFQQHGEKS